MTNGAWETSQERISQKLNTITRKRFSIRFLMQLKPLAFLLAIFLPQLSQAQTIITPFNIRYQVEQRGGIVYVSNSNLTCSGCGTKTDEAPPNGTTDNNGVSPAYIDIDSDSQTTNSSSSDLNLPSCSEITFAGLYWGGGAKRSSGYRLTEREAVKFKLPGAPSYLNLKADVDFGSFDDNLFPNFNYQCFKDVTSIIKGAGAGNGTYTVANVLVDNDISGDGAVEAGWTLVIVYKQEALAYRNLTVFDGFAGIPVNATPLTININGFATPPTGAVSFEMGFVAYEGDRGRTGDYIQFNNQLVSDASHKTNNTFNSSITRNGAVITTRNPSYANTFGYDASIMSPDNTSKNYLSNSATSANIKLATSQDRYAVGVVTTAIDVYNPYFSIYHTFTNVSNPGQPAKPGETVELLYKITNLGNDKSTKTVLYDALPPLMQFVPGSLEAYYGSGWVQKTDIAGDDEAEYVSGGHYINFRLGTGANATNGGSLSSGSVTQVRLRVKLLDDCDLLRCTSGKITNDAQISYWGNTNSDDSWTRHSAPEPASGQCTLDGPSEIAVDIPSSCSALPADRAFTIHCTENVSSLNLPSNYILYTADDVTYSHPLTTISSTGKYVGRRLVASGCEYKFTVDITLSPITITETHSNVSCYGSSTGWIKTAASGGTAPYTYSLGSVSNQTGQFSGLVAGNYTITAVDSKGCQSSVVVSLTAPVAPLAATVASVTDVGCGGNTGAITINVSGGTAPYAYLWSNGKTTKDISGLAAGTYSVQASDKNGCIVTLNATVSQPGALQLKVNSRKDVSCFGSSDGALDIEVSGGKAPYQFLWNNGLTTEDLTGLKAGSYTLTVTDANNCTATLTTFIAEPTVLNAVVKSVTDVACFGSSSGAVELTVSGGTAPYSFLWDNNATTQDLKNVPAGKYKVTVTDASGCTSSTDAEVKQPTSALQLVISSKTDVACYGSATGSIKVSVSGGTAPYTYKWNNNATTRDLDNLFAGTYVLEVTDANSCKASTSAIIINEPSAAFQAIITKQDVACYGGNSGSVNLNVTGGIPPYTYLWNTGETSQNLNTLKAGSYSVVIKDAKNCIATASATVTEPGAPLLASVTAVEDVSCYGGNDGTIDIGISGGTPPYTFLWSDNETAQNILGLKAGNYSVTVEDAKGCSTVLSATVAQPSEALDANLISQNPVCKGSATGAIDLTVKGGTPPYSYSWSSGAATEDLSGLAAETYTVTITDSKNCSLVKQATLSDPAALVASIVSKTDVSCYGTATGKLDLTVTGGTVPYTYNWSNNATTEDLANLSADLYKVTVTDAKGCSVTASATITQPASALTASITKTDVSCYGTATGKLDLTVTGGTAPYTYNWSNNATTEDLEDLVANTYSVTVTDAKGCSVTTSATISQPASALSASITKTDVNCYGTATGKLDLTVTGGTAPYTYNWGNSATAEDLTSLPAGLYTVTVTDAKGCSITASENISQPASALTASIAKTDVSCFGTATGKLDLTVTGGTAPYTYNWSNNATTEDLENLIANTYSVTVTDAKGCSVTASEKITQPASALSASIAKTDVSCYGTATGKLDLTVTGGTAPYAYNWSNNATTEDLEDLVANTYSVTVTDAKGCSVTASATISQPASALSASITKTDVNCYGTATGKLDLTVTGGTAPYTYNWSNNATTEDLEDLVANTYSVTVTDAKGCSVTTSATISQPASALSASITKTDVSCYGTATGKLDLTVTGGTAPYTYNWSNNATTEDLENLVANAYSVTVTDAKGCSVTTSATISQPASALSASIAKTDVSCYGTATGKLDLTVTGGTAPYTYNWSNNATTEDVANLSADLYKVTVTDAKGCSVTASATISQPASALSASIAKTDVNCYGTATGKLDLTVTGGTAPYTYNWSNNATTEDLENLVANTYSVTVTDAKGCSVTASAIISQPTSALSASITKTDVSCFGTATGKLDLTVTGGTAPYTYNWSNNTTTEDLEDLVANTYYVTVTDAKGCSVTASATTSQPASALTASIAKTDVNCYGTATGKLDLTVTGGTAPYTYNWSNNATTEDLEDLVANTYSVTVTDAKGCSVTTSEKISQPASALTASIAKTDVSCFGSATGKLDLTVTGGTAPYTYNWSNNATTEDLANLSADLYKVTVTDAKGCSFTASATISQPASALSASITKTDVNCYGTATGKLDLTVTGGTAPYTYNWGNNATTEDLENLVANAYSVTVTDAKGCSVTTSATISQPASALSASIAKIDVSCFGTATGKLDLTVTGGTAPYTYNWSNNTTTEDLEDLVANTYYVTVTDAKGCSVTTSATIDQPASALTASIAKTDVSCYGTATGKLDLTVTGGTAPYTYNWSNNATTEDLENLVANTYSVTVTDAKGCSVTASEKISQPASALTASIAKTDVSCFGSATGKLDLTVTGGTAPYTYNWSNNATTEDLANLSADLYKVTVTDAKGCSFTASEKISQPASALSASIAKTDVSCYGTATGKLDLTVTGGTAPYTYNWSNNATTEDLEDLVANAYSVTVTDAKGCSFTASEKISQPASALSASIAKTDVSCYGTATGKLDLTVTGGTSPYTYNWSNNATTEDVANLSADLYKVTVTDAKGCSVTTSATIDQPASALTASIVKTDVSCYGTATGKLDLTVTGGTAPHTYNWINNATTEDLENLVANTYSVTVTDAKGCSVTTSATIDQPASALTASIVKTDVSCYGTATGKLDLTVTGGTAPYTYNWSNNAITEDLENLVANTYSVTVTDAKGCSVTASATITQPASALTASITKTDVSCYGTATGKLDLTVTGGTAPYTYNWSNNATTEDLENLVANTYSVTVTDAKGCSVTTSATIDQPASALTASIVKTDVSCYGTATGKLDLTVTGGTAPYTYNWINNATTEDLENLVANTYSVTVTDAKGCSVTTSATIDQPASALTASIVKTDVSCYGTATGKLDLTVTGGTAPYTYNWSNNAITEDLENLVANTYSVTVTDAKGCSVTASATITQPASALTASITKTDVSCYGTATGKLDLTVTGGTVPYTYNWSNNATTEDLANLSADLYKVTVTDAKGCSVTASEKITQPASALTASITKTDVSCYGTATGKLDLTVTGGTAPYTYNWSNSATTEDLEDLVANTYSVTVTDAKGCSVTTSEKISQPASALTASIAKTDVSCFGSATGKLDLTVTGGTAPYTYNWSNNAITEDLENLSADLYKVTVTDAKGCSVTASATISQPASALSASIAKTDVSCFGSATGKLDLTVTGGTAPYTYNWSNNATTEDVANLSADLYKVTVTDAKGCSFTASATISQPASALTASITKTDVSCYGTATGKLDLTVTGGTAPYTYNWSNSATTEDLEDLVANTYSVTVTDAKGCSVTTSEKISQPASALTASIAKTDVSCFGSATGKLDLTVTGGTAPYTYNWSNNATTEDVANLSADLYKVTVTDAKGCSFTASATISQPASALSASIAKTDVNCYGTATGKLDLTVTGGTAPYTYNWINNATTEDLENLVANTYSVTVTDAKGCSVTTSATIDQPASALTASIVKTDVSCYGTATGKLDLTVTGGTAPHTYNWINNATTEDLENLVANTYSVTVTDAKGCSVTTSATIDQPASALTASIVKTDVSCYGTATGKLDLTVTGGTAPYTYNWSNNAITEDLENLVANTYSVTVTDAKGCSVTASATITQPASALTASITKTDVSCYGTATGKLDLTVTGGTAPYTYNWSNNATTEDLENLVANTYSVTVTDAKGCSVTTSATIDQPASALTASIVKTDVSCYGTATGKLDLTVTGGTAPYTYNWINNATTEDLENLVANTYSVTVTDAKGCSVTTSATIDQPASALTASIVKTDVSCYGTATGKLDLTVTGGTAPYTYNWSNNAITEDLENLVANTYSVTVTDAKGCSVTASATITQPASALTASITKTDVSCYGTATGKLDLTVTGGTVPYTYNWSNNATTEDLANLSADLYKVTVTDAKGCSVTASEKITQPASALTASITKTDVSCYGTATGKLDLTVTGGTAPYTYNWSNSATTEDLEDLVANTYSVTVTDAKGCSVTTSEKISQPASALTASIAKTDVSCFGSATGKLDLTVTGGTAPYTYNWSNNAITEDLENLSADLYKVTVTDAKGCSVTASATISQPASALSASIAKTDVSCFGSATGKLDLTVTGGTAPYTYNWSNNATTEDVANLSADLYKVTVTDAKGCSFTASATISQPASALTASITKTDVSCYGTATGKLDLTVTGGTAPYTYNWSNSATTEDLEDLVANTYSVTVTDAKGCSVTTSEKISQPASALTASIAKTDVSCFGSATGKLDLTVTGGTAPYTYNWSNNATTEDVANLSADLYKVTVTDAKGCSFTASATISQPASALSASIAKTDVNCYGTATGKLDLTVTGGTAPYTYNWINNATTEDLENLVANTYSVTVTDAKGCSVTTSATIDQPASALTASIVKTDVSCYGTATGKLDLTVTGGTAPHTYNWINNATTEDLENLVANTYSVTVTDAKGCSVTTSATIDQPASALTASIVKTDVSCYGTATGKLDLTVTGGTAPYTYNWSNNAITEDLENLVANTYSVTVTDAKGCSVTASATITQPASALTASITKTDVSCYGTATGKLDLTVTGGTAPYTYNWSNNATTEDLENLVANTYSVTVTDAKGCSVTTSATIDQPASALTASIVKTDVSCYGTATGKLDLTVTGGTAPYTYNWSNNATTEDLENLVANTYSVTVTDAKGCSVTTSATIDQPASALTASIVKTDVSCYGTATGKLDLTVTGGTAPYTYNWINNATTEDLENLVANTYSVTVTDAKGCSVTTSATIDQPASALTASIVKTDVSCYGTATGKLDLTVTGGTAPYTYNWSNNAITEDLENLVANTYSVTVTDAKGCSVTASATITQPASALTASITKTDVSCYGTATGKLDLTVTGGTAPYTYNWSNNAITEDLENLVANTYSVTVTDAKGCSVTASATITQPASALTASITKTDVSCYGTATGKLDLTVTGGTAPYTYNWSNNTTTEDLEDLVANTYSVTVTDAKGCSVTTSATISQPASALSASIAKTDVSCYGTATGKLDLTVTGGTAPYTYNWSNNATTEDLGNLVANAYFVTVTDAKGCSVTASATITQPASALSASIAKTDVSCYGTATGKLDLTVTGGTVPYTYNWSNNATTEDLEDLVANTYSVTVTDAKGCSVTASATITQPASALTASITKTDVSCYGTATGKLDLTVTGGTAPYTYNWSNNTTTEDLEDLVANTYYVTVTDAKGCSVTTSATIDQPASALTASIVKTDVSCFGSATGKLDLTVTGGTAPYTYNWINNATTEDLANLSADLYKVTVTDAKGCSVTASEKISQPASALTASIVKTDVSCYGTATGKLDLTVTGGTAPYTYNWINNATTEDLENLVANTYSVTVTDAKGCSVTTSATIDQPASALSASIAKTDVSCYGTATGRLDLTVTGGTAPYTYNWSNNATTEDVANLSADLYKVTVTDAKGCSVTASEKISQPASALSASITKTDVNCYGTATGKLDLTVTGGTAPYTYNWSNNAITEDLENLSADLYKVTVTDAKGCSVTASATISQPASALSASIAKTDVSCFGSATGKLDLTVTGGTAPYAYNWSNNATTEDLENLIANTYSVTVTDAKGCSVTTSATIDQPASALSASIAKIDVSCFGTATGKLDLTVTGGNAPYTYNWSNNAITEDLANLSADLYKVTVTDAKGCSVTASATISQPASALSAFIAKTNVSCYGTSTGKLDLSVNGGTAPYTYKWSNNTVSEDLLNIPAGLYSVTITDAKGCSITASESISQPASALSASIAKTDVSCFGTATGKLDLSVNGGTAPYTYKWSNNTVSEDLLNIPAGLYSVTITDAKGCSITASETITQPTSALSASITKTDVSCFGTATGKLDLTVTGGTAPYTYNWSNNATTEDLENLPAGTYTVTVTDSRGCSAVGSIIISQPQALSAAVFEKKDVQCFGTATGLVKLKVAGGTEPYTYSWSNGATSKDLSGLAAGHYTVTISDANQCAQIKLNIIISNPAVLAAKAVSKETSCKYSNDGSIEIDVTGGVQPYAYKWEGRPDINTPYSYNLVSGTYNITITDANGCTTFVSKTVDAGNCSPLAKDDILSTERDIAVSGNVSLNDSDPDKDALTFQLKQNAANGLVTFNADGTFTYKPADGFTGLDVFSYQVCDARGACATAKVIISVSPLSLVYLSPQMQIVPEGKKVVVTAMLKEPFSEDVVITFKIKGTATKEQDFFLFDQFEKMVIPKGSTTTKEKISIAALTDNLQEGDENLTISIATVSNSHVKIGSGAEVVIADVYPPLPPVVIPIKDEPVNTDIVVHPLVSPNGDDRGNDFFHIDNIWSYMDNEVVIFNRWGTEVFRMKNYNDSDRVFKGYSNKGLLANTSSPLPDGVYYYLIYTYSNLSGPKVKNLNKGYLILKR